MKQFCLREGSGNGWSAVTEQAPSLEKALDDIAKLKYEIDHATRGAYTRCHTAQELSFYINRMAASLSRAAKEVAEAEDDY